MENEQFTDLLKIRIRPSEKELLRRAAATKGRNLSDFTRGVLLPLARRRLRAAEQGGEARDQ